jgi:hypothetical protein
MLKNTSVDVKVFILMLKNTSVEIPYN